MESPGEGGGSPRVDGSSNSVGGIYANNNGNIASLSPSSSSSSSIDTSDSTVTADMNDDD